VPKSPPTVFISYAREDLEDALKLYNDLKRAGANPWLDRESLLPGQRWEIEIRRAIRENRYFLAVLSSNSVSRRGYVHKEVAEALKILDEFPESEIFIIPARLDGCSPSHESLRDLHWVDMFPKWEDGLKKILLAIQVIPEDETVHPDVLERPQPIKPEMVLIPAGEFLMGSDPNIDKDARDHEQPQRFLYLPDYYLAKTPVTNAQYAPFVQATYHAQPKWWKGGKQPPLGREGHSVVYVSWFDALDYCRWLSEVTGKPYRLPSEAEWEKGARGSDGRIYPWGNEWNAERCNSKEGGPGDTMPVGTYPEGASSYGLLDMAGNVWEWTRSLYKRYPYDQEDVRGDLNAPSDVIRVKRGGAFDVSGEYVRCACRSRDLPNYSGWDCGFRLCVVSQQD
jgi:formylglycine-generating enzyme required for sulfatase activity